MTAQSLFTDRDALASLCRRRRIRRLSLFGSVLRGTDRQDSDVDLLIEFAPDAKPSLLDLADFERDCRVYWAVAESMCARPKI